MKKLLLTLFILTTTVNLSAQSWWNSKKVRGNGKITTEKRSVGNFDEVSVGGSFDVILVDGREGEITIEGEENIIPYIITEVKKGKLKIEVKKNTNLRFNRKLTVTVPFEKIDGIGLGGSGNVRSEKTVIGEKVSLSIGGSGNIKTKVKASSLSTSIGGSGNIRVSGSTESMRCSIAGSGNVKAYNVTTNTLKVNVAGSGDIEATVKEKIKATVVGSGSVYYKGNPKYIDTNSVGSGDVVKRD
ncbi:head GIN domain-containing protein [uncultured Tenacibaculum sp.]|uniref:head GIN domain-containing protein n=1 Tax=uncultured Tenacibaculum sp. TaxID=174713 RepID=UPI00261FFFDA|nr:head GIN domain-containing protein [uncultured Tenacibaculum sp.]